MKHSHKLRREFVINQRFTIRDLLAELAVDHFATGHRLVHTIKVQARLIGEETLGELALKVEQNLRKKTHPEEADLAALDAELTRVINEISYPEYTEHDDDLPSTEEQAALLDRIHELLSTNDAACLEHISELKQIRETAVLIRQIESFSFEHALVTLAVLREVLEV